MLSRLRSFPTGRAAGALRFSLWALLLTGAGVVVHQRANLALIAGAPELKPAGAVMRPPGGSLVICGGGTLPDSVREHFVNLAGGRHAKIVVIPTASSIEPDSGSDERMRDWWKTWPVESLTLLHTRSRETADSEEFVRPLAEATGVWFNGGSQGNLSAAYLNTEVERQLVKLLQRGGVIGGTSAGASIMSRVMILGGRTDAVLGDGFDFLPGTVIDQHFLKRNRMPRLMGIMRNHPELVGLGIDEATALVVDVKNRRFRVMGDSYVVAVVPETQDKAASFRVDILKPGDEVDMTALRERPTEAIASSIDLNAM